jgi:hypothetical protein
MQQLWTHYQGLLSRVESTQGKGGKGKSGGRSKIGGIGIGKRMKSPTAACRATKDSELKFELVQISLDKSNPLLTVQIQPEHQAETFSSLIDSAATA